MLFYLFFASCATTTTKTGPLRSTKYLFRTVGFWEFWFGIVSGEIDWVGRIASGGDYYGICMVIGNYGNGMVGFITVF